MTQLELGLEAKRKGKASAAKHHAADLERARKIARELARFLGTVSADEVQERLYPDSWGKSKLGNASGSIFYGGEWECVGYRPSLRPSRHGGLLRVWRLK